MKLLLLGSSGQLGQAFLRQSQWQHWHSLAPSRAQLDIGDAAAVITLLNQYQPDIIINCAAYTAVDDAELHRARCLSINSTAVQQLAQWCAAKQALLVHFSTDYVFNGTKSTAYTEADTPAPLNVYGQSKLLGEQAIQQYCEKYLLIRTSWLFSQFGRNFYRTMLNLAQGGNTIKVVNDQFGCPTYAGDIAQIVLQLLARYKAKQQLSYGLYHLSGSPAVSWYQFACAIFSAHQPSVPLQAVSSQHWASKAQRPANSALDSTKFFTTFAIAPLNWQQALIKFAE